MKLLCSELSYFPDSISNKHILLGYVFHDFLNKKIFFKLKKYDELGELKDEISEDDYNLIINSTMKFINEPFLTKSEKCSDRNYLGSITNNFLNEFRLSTPKEISANNEIRGKNDEFSE